MDIPRVLQNLKPGVAWGPCANTSNTYGELAANWPAASGTVPTEAAMNTEWTNISNADAALKTDAQVATDIDTYLTNITDANTKAALKACMMTLFKLNDQSLNDNGCAITR